MKYFCACIYIYICIYLEHILFWYIMVCFNTMPWGTMSIFYPGQAADHPPQRVKPHGVTEEVSPGLFCCWCFQREEFFQGKTPSLNVTSSVFFLFVLFFSRFTFVFWTHCMYIYICIYLCIYTWLVVFKTQFTFVVIIFMWHFLGVGLFSCFNTVSILSFHCYSINALLMRLMRSWKQIYECFRK